MYQYFYKYFKNKLGWDLYHREDNEDGTTPPPISQQRITEDGQIRITEDGQIRITE